MREALFPLLMHRRGQASRNNERLYREWWGTETGLRPGETKLEFLARQGTGPGPVNPKKMPYYLLLVGDPEAIPYQFQYHLGVEYAVGRLHFDAVADYENYARSVVRSETVGVARGRRIAFLNPTHTGDRPTRLLADLLTRPLSEQVATECPDWAVSTAFGAEVTKAVFRDRLFSLDSPALVFTAGHGLGFPAGDPRQTTRQGALVCAEWPGPPAARGPVRDEHCLSADDIPDDANLVGRVAIQYASFAAGTSRLEESTRRGNLPPVPIAPQSFVSPLARRLLAHRRGGMLAVLGPAERSWGFSYPWPQTKEIVDVFASVVSRLLEGLPVGAATEVCSAGYASIATLLMNELEDVRFGKVVDDTELAGLWATPQRHEELRCDRRSRGAAAP